MVLGILIQERSFILYPQNNGKLIDRSDSSLAKEFTCISEELKPIRDKHNKSYIEYRKVDDITI